MSTADDDRDFDLLAEIVHLHDREGRCAQNDLIAALPDLPDAVGAGDARRAIERLVASGQAERVGGDLVPTVFGREVVARAHVRGSTNALLLVGALFADLDAARSGADPLAPRLVVELETERDVGLPAALRDSAAQAGTIDCSIDEAKARGWLRLPVPPPAAAGGRAGTPVRLGYLRTPVGEVWELADPAPAFERDSEVERIRVVVRSFGVAPA